MGGSSVSISFSIFCSGHLMLFPMKSTEYKFGFFPPKSMQTNSQLSLHLSGIQTRLKQLHGHIVWIPTQKKSYDFPKLTLVWIWALLWKQYPTTYKFSPPDTHLGTPFWFIIFANLWLKGKITEAWMSAILKNQDQFILSHHLTPRLKACHHTSCL